MSNDNTLDDLILTEPEPEKTKSRGLLALLALVILLIIVGAILAKMIFSDPDEPTKAKDDTKVEVASDINPDIDKIDANTKDSNSKDSNMSSDLAPITADPDLAPLNDNAIAANVDTVDVDENKNAKDKNAKGSENLKGDSSKVANEEEDLGVAPVGKAATAKKEEDVPKRVVVKEKPAKEARVRERTTTRHQSIGGRGNVYIQVGSFTKGPERSFIRKITRAGFKYRIKTQNGYRRVYVGPFESRKEAAKYLGRVRSEINPQAFIK